MPENERMLDSLDNLLRKTRTSIELTMVFRFESSNSFDSYVYRMLLDVQMLIREFVSFIVSY